MRVYGIDFTSRPSPSKKITCLECSFDGSLLRSGKMTEWPNFDGFEKMLRSPGPWIVGIDFPFGQSRKFVEEMKWPTSWCDYIDQKLKPLKSREDFRDLLDDYKEGRDYGDKEHSRETDICFGSLSPQKQYGVPVAMMFFEGAFRLRDAGVMIPGLQEDGDPDRVVVEAYPAVLARELVGRRSYKRDQKGKQTSKQRAVREKMLSKLTDWKPEGIYGITVQAPDSLAFDPTGDQLDALLCAVQATWAWRNREDNFGLKTPIDPTEGWIANPILPKRRGKISC